MDNRPFPGSKNPPFQSEVKCKPFLVIMISIYTSIKIIFISTVSLSLALKQRLGATQKWPLIIQTLRFILSKAVQQKKTKSTLTGYHNKSQTLSFGKLSRSFAMDSSQPANKSIVPKKALIRISLCEVRDHDSTL